MKLRNTRKTIVSKAIDKLFYLYRSGRISYSMYRDKVADVRTTPDNAGYITKQTYKQVINDICLR